MIYAGCDLGIVSAKVVIVEDGRILACEVLPYKNHPRQAAVEVMDKALAKVGLTSGQIDSCLSTGFGHKAVPYADGDVPDTVCLHRAIRHLNLGVSTVVDVGGHTLAAFSINESGRVWEFAVTDVCAAGTGLSIDVMAKALEMPLDELIRASLDVTSPVPMVTRCVVFAESEVVSLINAGNDRFDIFAGVASAVASRIASVIRKADMDRGVAMAGGVAKNAVVVKDLERRLGLKLADLRGLDPQVVAAFGAALMAEERRRAS